MMAPDIATMESSWTIAIGNTSEGRSISFQYDKIDLLLNLQNIAILNLKIFQKSLQLQY